jgi:hypothetical protein
MYQTHKGLKKNLKRDLEAYNNVQQKQVDRAKELAAKKEEAENKAKELLLDLIGEEEMKVYEETGRLLVHGNKFDYIVQKFGYVKKIEKDKVVDLCVHLKDKYSFPESDNVIALKLLLEHDEDQVLKVANVRGENSLSQIEGFRCANGERGCLQ